MEGELVVLADPGPDLDALLARYGGEVVKTLDPSAAGIAGVAQVHLVRIDPATADPAGLPSDARATEPLAQGAHGVSSAAGLGTLAASLAASADGLAVGLNALDEGAGLRDETTTEAGAATSVGPRRARRRPAVLQQRLRLGLHGPDHPQGIGVAEAWQRMDAAGMLEGAAGSVSLAIIDDGFGREDPDRLPGATVISPEGLATDAPGQFGERGIFGCGMNNPSCPWHGHQVTSAAAAQVDNGRGAAGPAAPVARLILVSASAAWRARSPRSSAAVEHGADIVNMSFGARIPSSAAATLEPLRQILDTVIRNNNTLVVVAAGNNGIDVGLPLCLPGCWDAITHSPCELEVNVLCVGGVAAGAAHARPRVELRCVGRHLRAVHHVRRPEP